MSERAFFSLRHSIPGFTFIALIVSTNLAPIFGRLGGAEAGTEIFVGFLSLFSGPAFGFLISQFWWFTFHCLDAEWRLDPSMFDAFLKKFKFRKPESQQQKARLIPVLDYILHYEGYIKEDSGRDKIFRWQRGYLSLHREKMGLIPHSMF